ncbi:putative MarR family transcriptional regulator [Listeria floridensis FSL S10-1187]|uniref:MarR family transcriptional regulator n=1 Tax=Listeria floridensis FSL S10-1187 TaxID=1265817 RepID=A0ABP3B139_9LIST|nr:MarR family transcriptional regulator [Listeria floridensis]EUJ33013.1 putative MarR family transcriptional regulator [Listeria floridensis FSL S10-1187]
MENYLEIETAVKRVLSSFRHDLAGVLDGRLSVGEYRVLSLIESGITKTSDLAKKLDVSASHITSLTDALVAMNYITRQRSETDRRIIQLSLTKEAKLFVQKSNKEKRELMIKRFSVFSESEQAEFKRLLKKLSDDI